MQVSFNFLLPSFLLRLWDRVSRVSRWNDSGYIAKGDLELLLLPPPPKSYDYESTEPNCSIQCWALCVFGKHCPNKLFPGCKLQLQATNQMCGHSCLGIYALTWLIREMKGKWQKRRKLQSLQSQKQNSFEKWTTAQGTNTAVCGISVAPVIIFQIGLWYAQF